jgi:hypothetical protein
MNAPDRKYPDLPRDIEAEAQFIGALFMARCDLPAVLPMVTRDDFSEEVHALIYDGVAQLAAKGEAVSPVTVKAMIGEHVLAGEMTVSQYLARLVTAAPLASQAPTLAGLIRQAADARRLVQIGYRVERDWQTSNRERLIADSIALVDTVKQQGAASAKGIEATFVHDLSKDPPKRDWIVRNALLARAFHLVIGEPGCGKSFLALDLAMNLALAAVDERHSGEWFGNKIKPSGVVYIAAEGEEDFLIRIHAWLAAKGLPAGFRMPFALIPTAIDMRTDATGTDRLIRCVKEASAVCKKEFGVEVSTVVIDTVNRSLNGGDDSKADHIGAFIANCTRLKAECKVSAIGVHHTIKAGGTTDPRGHGSLKGDNDGQWFVSPPMDGTPNRFRVTRLKSGATGAVHEFRLRQVAIPVEGDDEDPTSCVVTPLASVPSIQEHEMRDATEELDKGKSNMTRDGRAILPDNATIIMRALARAAEDEAGTPPFGVRVPSRAKATTMKRWLEEIIRVRPGIDKETAQFRNSSAKAQERAGAVFSRRGLIGIDGEWVWRTSRRVAGVDKMMVAPSEEDAAPSGIDAPLSEMARNLSDDGLPF